MSNIFPSDFEEFIYTSRYSRWLPEEGRREYWNETVDRYINFMADQSRDKQGYDIPDATLDKIGNAIAGFSVMPSMRALMTAGPALSRDNTAGYNCSYLPVDDPKAFDEALFVLMCGTGVGFSVEERYIQRLPEVPHDLVEGDTIITVADSKEGWAKSFRKLLALLWAGEIPSWDTSKVRKAGERLRTFGGRASGPAPLEDLFQFTIELFQKARGRRLRAIECHDIMCKIGEIVVVGGVRRSAMISLSDLTDSHMRSAKSGAWWEHNSQRALANNSAVYTERPDMDTFLSEWTGLVASKSGERGIFSRYASEQVAKTHGRRKLDQEWGTNPCSEICLRPYQFCNLSEVVVRPHDTLEVLLDKVETAAVIGTLQSSLTHFPYLRKIWQRNTEEERLLGVSLTGIMDHPVLNGSEGSTKLSSWLIKMREQAVATNKDWAGRLGIPESAAITCVKPSGTVSQLVDSASGIHTRHNPHYIRTVRGDKKDPLTQFMIDAGIPAEDCVMKPDSTVVFSFPKKAPDNALCRNDVTALAQLDLWLTYQQYWCEHKPSVTISVKEDEWLKVGAWVYDHFDSISGISFLPFSEHTYRQAPYQDITQEEYDELVSQMPSDIDWAKLSDYEAEDNTVSSQALACSSGSCEIVDIGQ